MKTPKKPLSLAFKIPFDLSTKKNFVNKADYYKAKLSDKDFYKISEFVETNYGIRLPRLKKAMVQNRLYKRLIQLETITFEDYVKLVFSSKGRHEIPHMVDEITTNKTDFFRESKHFDFLEKELLPTKRNFQIWCAGCSTGEEPYTISMLLNENNLQYNILGTDLSHKVIKLAQAGIYNESLVNGVIPDNLVKKYFTKDEKTYKISDTLKNKVKYKQLNLLDSNYQISNTFDIIFFRNVLIYFDIKTQSKILRKMLPYLKEGGYIFIGHSETIYDKDLPFESVSHAVYKKKQQTI